MSKQSKARRKARRSALAQAGILVTNWRKLDLHPRIESVICNKMRKCEKGQPSRPLTLAESIEMGKQFITRPVVTPPTAIKTRATGKSVTNKMDKPITGRTSAAKPQKSNVPKRAK